MDTGQKRAIAGRVSAICKELEAIQGEIPYGVIFNDGKAVIWNEDYEREVDILTSARFALMNIVAEFSGRES